MREGNDGYHFTWWYSDNHGDGGEVVTQSLGTNINI